MLRTTRRKAGKGGRQLLYLMTDRHTNDVKIGISNRPDIRAVKVTEENRKGGNTKVLAHWWFINARRVEQFLHRAFFWMNHPRSGDGGTEWFDPDSALWMLICVGLGFATNLITAHLFLPKDQGVCFWGCVFAGVVLRSLLFRVFLVALIWLLWVIEKGFIVVALLVFGFVILKSI